MANSTVCQSKWKPIVEPRRTKPKTYRQIQTHWLKFYEDTVIESDTQKRFRNIDIFGHRFYLVCLQGIKKIYIFISRRNLGELTVKSRDYMLVTSLDILKCYFNATRSILRV